MGSYHLFSDLYGRCSGLAWPGVMQYWRDNGIVVQACCPIMRNQKADDPTHASIVKMYGVTSDQILLRWNLKKGWVSPPKSDNPDRIRLNCDVFGFDLSTDEESLLDELSQGAAYELVRADSYRLSTMTDSADDERTCIQVNLAPMVSAYAGPARNFGVQVEDRHSTH